MKVFLITKEAYPNGMAATNRINCYAKGLNSAGIECKIIISTRTEVYGAPVKNIKPTGDNYQYISKKTRRESNVLLRKYNDYLDYVKTIRFIKKNCSSEDIILTYLREDPLNKLVLRAAKKTGAKVVRDLCEYPFGTKKEGKKYIKQRNTFLKKIFPKFDGFICISEPLVELAFNHKSLNAKVVKIPIMVIPEEEEEEGVNENKLNNRTPYIFHSGTLYEQKDGILGALEAFAIAEKKLEFPIKYFLTGDLAKSPVKAEINEIIKKYQLESKVIFTGFLTVQELQAYQKGCSLMIINKLDNQQNRYCFATKLGDYLLAEKPIITTSVGESSNYLKDGKSAYIIKPGDNVLLAKTIIDVFSNRDKSALIAKNGKEVALNNFSYKVQGGKLAYFLKSL